MMLGLMDIPNAPPAGERYHGASRSISAIGSQAPRQKHGYNHAGRHIDGGWNIGITQRLPELGIGRDLRRQNGAELQEVRETS
jgi:hypothetical protein